MTVDLKPETKALIWVSSHREEISAGIQKGWDEAQRGELIDSEDVRAGMQRTA
jgi:predicted transcriptional regulator